MLRTLILSAVLGASPARAGPPAVPRHLVEAFRLLRGMKPENTSYVHGTPDVRWEGARGARSSACHTDCSGFIGELIVHSYRRYDGESLRRWFGVKNRPLARHFFEAIRARRGFTRVENVNEVLPGDLIAVKYRPGERAGNDTGHVMLVVARPKKRTASGGAGKGTGEWQVRVMDVTRRGHGRGDSRYRGRHGGKRVYRRGLGTGSLRLYAYGDGAIEGYSWSLAKASRHYGTREVPLAFGRLDPKFEP